MSTSDVISGSNSLYKIDPLRGRENYPPWKIKMMDILIDQSLYDYASGEAKCPTVDPNGTPDAKAKEEEAVAVWRKKDRSALTAIRLRVTDACMVFVAGAKTSAEAWEAFRQMYKAQGPAAVLLARCTAHLQVAVNPRSDSATVP